MRLPVHLINPSISIWIYSQKESISFVELEADNVTKEFIAEEQETEEYFNNNLEQFSIPEKRSFLLLNLNKNEINLEVSDTELEEAYNLFLENLPAPEKRVSHMLIIRDNYTTDLEYQEKVATVTKELEAAEFSDLVKGYSDDLGTTDTDGDLGFTNWRGFSS